MKAHIYATNLEYTPFFLFYIVIYTIPGYLFVIQEVVMQNRNPKSSSHHKFSGTIGTTGTKEISGIRVNYLFKSTVLQSENRI